MISGPGTKLYGAVLSACVLFPFHGCFHKAHHDTDYADNVQKVVASPTLGILKTANYQEFQPQVAQFYGSREYALAWTDGGVITPQATGMMEQFSNAADKGLNPDDYDASRWAERVQKVHQVHDGHDTSQTAQDTIAEFDAALTISTMRYLQDLHTGRINPQQLNFDIDVPAKREAFNMPQFLEAQLLSSNDIPSLITGIEPKNPFYTATEKALPKYMALAKQQDQAGAEPLPDVSKPISAGGSYPALAQLVNRLQLEQMSAGAAEGNDSATQSPAGPAPGTRYTQNIAELVKTYQEQHGLDPDGKLTSATIDSLNVPVSQRVQQIGDALERWRWLPDEYQQPRVLVNLPEYVVRTYDADHNLVFAMKAIDGKNDGHDTPVFVRKMTYVVFRPFWNLPISIVKKDIVRHDRAWMDAHDYEVTDSQGKPVSGWSMHDLEHSRYMVRQKPGPKNSLGLIKFMFPNEYNIYLHSTPEMQLFNLTNRDKSHGCVRLQDVEKMANWVLDGQGDWDSDKVHEAIYGPEDGGGEAKDNHTVGLKQPLTVSLTYLTAIPGDDGQMHFLKDVYGYDKDMDAIFAKGRPYPSAQAKINPKIAPGETE